MSGGGITYKLAYGGTDAVGNPSLLQYKIGTAGTAYVEQDPTTGQATMLHKTDDEQILYQYDGTGSLVGLLTDAATTAGTYKYDPYGLGFVDTTDGGNGIGQNPFSFKSGIQDRATGFVKFGQRWYNTVTGSWTQQDTLDAPLDPANANRYAYAGDDPINNYDPLGASCAGDAIFGFTGAALTVTGYVLLVPGVGPELGLVAGTVTALSAAVGSAVSAYGLISAAQSCSA